MYQESTEERMDDELRLQGRADRTIDTYMRQVKQFKRYIGCPLKDANSEHSSSSGASIYSSTRSDSTT